MMKKALLLLVALVLLVPGMYEFYGHIESLNTMRCLGCIAMEPKAIAFEEFWISYPGSYKNSGIPEHPAWIVNESRNNVVMLFFWGPGCEPCESQWEKMKRVNLVKGTEADGMISENYSYVSLFSINAPFDEKGDALKIYQQKGEIETPTTVVLFERNNTIYWYSFSGEANGHGGRPSINDLIRILETAWENQHDMRL